MRRARRPAFRPRLLRHICASYSRAARRLAVLAPIPLCACHAAVLDPRGPVGLAERTILIDSVIIMLAIVLPTMAAILGSAWWFRAGNTRAFRWPNWDYSGRIELVVWSIPLMTIILLGGVAWIGSHRLDPAKPLSDAAPLRIQAVSLDWKWLFIYPEQRIATVNQLVLPAGQPVEFYLTSGSVMTAFFIPRLGSMIYTMNGMVTRLNLQADAPGSMLGEASHFSGDGFSDMHFVVRALPAADFVRWVDATKGSGTRLDTAGYTELERQSSDVPPAVFGAVDPRLFQRVVSQELPPGPGPEFGRPNASVSPRREP